MEKHKHHIVPRHLGGSDDKSNIEELHFIEHAKIHALRYLAGLDRQFDYRHHGWRYLCQELRAAVRAEHSLRFKTDINPMKNPETAQKVADNRRGKSIGKGRKWSEKSKDKMRGENNPNYGGKNCKPMSEERRKEQSERMAKNNPMKDPEVAKKVSESKRGKPSSRKGAKLSEETKQKLREANLGRKASPEARAKMSESRKGKKRGPYKK